MANPEQRLEAMAGEPIELKLGGTTLQVPRMTIERERAAVKAIQNGAKAASDAGRPEDVADAIMAKVVSIAADVSEEEITRQASLAQLYDAFVKIWRQNELGFLLERVRELTTLLSEKA